VCYNNNNNNNNNNNVFKSPFRRPRTSSGTSLCPRQPSIYNNRWRSRTKGLEEVGTLIGSVVPSVSLGFKKIYGGKRCVFNEERNKDRVGQDRSARGREFQIDGAAYEKERRPFADRMSGTVRKNLSLDLRFLVGI